MWGLRPYSRALGLGLSSRQHRNMSMFVFLLLCVGVSFVATVCKFALPLMPHGHHH